MLPDIKRWSFDKIRSLPVFLISFGVLFALSACWAFASPMMSVPDEPSHAIKAAAVVRGELSGQPTGSPGQTLEVNVPRWVANGHDLTCYAFKDEVTPNCSSVTFDGSSETVPAVTSAGNYNPVYYAIVGLPSLVSEGFAGLYGMRLMSSALSCLFLAGMFAAIVRLRRGTWLFLAASVSVTPMVLYLNGGINPNSLEFATVGAIFANLVLLLERSDDRRIYPSTVPWIALGAALLANTKALSLLWLLIVVVASFWCAGLAPINRIIRNVWFWCGALIIAIASSFALWWIASANSLESQPFAGAGSTFFEGLQTMFDRTFEYTNGLIGYFGWLDTPAPAGVLALWAAAIGSIVIPALALGSGRTRGALIFAVATFGLLPPILQAIVVTEQGFIWQGRYILALFLVVMLTAGSALDARFGGYRSASLDRIVLWGLVLVAFAHVYAFTWALRRYVIGIADGLNWTDMIFSPAWQPPFGALTWVLAFAGLVGFSSWLVYRTFRSMSSRPLPGQENQPSEATGIPTIQRDNR